MSNTSADTEHLIRMINKEKAKVLIPVIVYLTVLMVTGFVGNCMVCFFYGFKTKTTPTFIFIVTLAIYDIIICTISMPTEIVYIVQFYSTKPGPDCKIIRFISYCSTIASMLTLIAIAIDRHTLITRLSSKPMTVKYAKKCCVMVVGGAILLSWPIPLVYDWVLLSVPNTPGLELKAYDCTFQQKSSFELYISLFHILLVLIVAVCTTGLVVLYGKVVYVIFKHKRKLAQYRNNSSQECNGQTPNETETNSQTTRSNETQPTTIYSSDTRANTIMNREPMPMLQQSSTDNTHNETVRISIVMISITLLFILSFIPYLASILWYKNTKGMHEGQFSNTQLVMYALGTRSTFINSSFNPFIYGIFNSKFRNYYCRRLCCRCK